MERALCRCAHGELSICRSRDSTSIENRAVRRLGGMAAVAGHRAAVHPLAYMPWQRPNSGSRVIREVHARLWERLGGQSPRTSRQSSPPDPALAASDPCPLFPGFSGMAPSSILGVAGEGLTLLGPGPAELVPGVSVRSRSG